MKALDFEILRDVEANGLLTIDLPRKPVRVATMINEALFEQTGHTLQHQRTVFLEDKYHDWDWKDGKFRYYTRVAKRADVLIVYELQTASVTPIVATKDESAEVAYNLQRIIDAGRQARPKFDGGIGENKVYLTPAMYDALQKAIELIKEKK